MSDPLKFLQEVFPDGVASHEQRKKRPFVTLTYAQSLDGCIAGKDGAQILLSGKESMIMTHWLRTMHDGILVGRNTVQNDNPQLNTRHLPPRDAPYPQPRPVILDTALRTPPTCKLLSNYAGKSGVQPWIISGRPKSWSGLQSPTQARRDERKEKLEAAGAMIIEVGALDEKGNDFVSAVNIREALEGLSDLGIRSIMVEGGASIISSFLGLVDEDGEPTVDMHIVTVTPTFIGATGIPATNAIRSPPKLHPIANVVLGKDSVFASQLSS